MHLSTTVNYDSVGNVTKLVDRLGRERSFEYDLLNRIARATYFDAVVSASFDAAGRLIQVTDTQGGPINWVFDDANRLLSETTSAGIVNYDYNAAGERTSMAVENRPPITYGYDAAGRLTTIRQATETFSYSYDVLSRHTALTRPNGVTTTYTYDDVNRLSRLTHADSLNQPLEDLQYGYNLDDEITSVNSIAQATLLPGSQSVGAANGVNRVGQFGASALTFDAEGQTQSRTTAQGTTQYMWDARGRLIQVQQPDGQIAAYSYDVLGRRMTHTANGVTTNFLYDGLDVVVDQSSDSSSRDYLNALNIDEKLSQSSSAMGKLYLLQDHLGSTVALTNSSGAVVERARYEAFVGGSNSALTRYGYTGREREGLNGLIYYRARWYDPEQGRFLSEDPIGFEGGLNLIGATWYGAWKFGGVDSPATMESFDPASPLPRSSWPNRADSAIPGKASTAIAAASADGDGERWKKEYPE